MNVYRITLRLNGTKTKFLIKAKSILEALSEWLVTSFDKLSLSQELIKTIQNSVKTNSDYNFIYENNGIIIECSKSMNINQDKLFYYDSDAEIFIYQHLSEEIKLSMDTEDVAFILELEFEYLEDNNFIDVDEQIISQEPPPVLEMEVLSKFIQKRAMDEGILFSIDQINEVLEKEEKYMEYIGIIKS